MGPDLSDGPLYRSWHASVLLISRALEGCGRRQIPLLIELCDLLVAELHSFLAARPRRLDV